MQKTNKRSPKTQQRSLTLTGLFSLIAMLAGWGLYVAFTDLMTHGIDFASVLMVVVLAGLTLYATACAWSGRTKGAKEVLWDIFWFFPS